MKKLLLSLISILAVISLTACGADSNAEISNPDETIITIGDTIITKEQVYTLMENENIVPIILNDVNEKIFDSKVILDDTTIAEIEDEFNQTIVDYGGEDIFEATLQQYGYPDIETYKQELFNAAKASELVKAYAIENISNYQSEYSPKMIQTMGYSTQEDAQKALELLESGKTFEEVAIEMEYTATIEAKLATNYSTDIPAVIIVALTATSEPGVLPTTFANEDNTIYYIANVTDVDVTNFTDEFVEMLSSDSDISTEVIVSYYDSMNFHVYDQKLFTKFEAEYPNYLVQN
jgi:foldase protein PrsA